MAYATSNPPRLLVPSLGGIAGRIWQYRSTDAAAVVDTTGYITNGGDLGMKVNDVVFAQHSTTGLMTSHIVVTVSSTAPGAVDLSDGIALTSVTNTD